MTGPPLTRAEVAAKRLIAILDRHGVANARILEQKISDAGPTNQRIDPHILTPVRKGLVELGTVVEIPHGGIPWFALASTPKATIDARLQVLGELHGRTSRASFTQRL